VCKTIKEAELFLSWTINNQIFRLLVEPVQ
jgi:hypothetical protein